LPYPVKVIDDKKVSKEVKDEGPSVSGRPPKYHHNFEEPSVGAPENK